MMGLFKAPAVIRLPDCASTPVISPVAVGQKLERASRVTCWEARAISRATEIWGLFLTASCSACFKVNGVEVPGLGCGVGEGGVPPGIGELAWVEEFCGEGADGNESTFLRLTDVWAQANRGKAKIITPRKMDLCFRFI